jgi:hypothetical protein
VLYPSQQQARDFVEVSRTMWEDCASARLTVADGPLLTQMSMRRDAEAWGCQHALSAVSNLTGEAVRQELTGRRDGHPPGVADQLTPHRERLGVVGR